MTVVLLGPADGDLAALRLVAHLEAGHQVVYEGDMTAELWWPATRGTVEALLDARRDR